MELTRAASTLVVVIAFSTPAVAETIAQRSKEGTISLVGEQVLGNGCLSLPPNFIQGGAPEGAMKILDTASATIKIAHSGADFCTQSMSRVPFEASIADVPRSKYVILYRCVTRTGPTADTSCVGEIVPIR